jgi:hypothetical protein
VAHCFPPNTTGRELMHLEALLLLLLLLLLLVYS